MLVARDSRTGQAMSKDFGQRPASSLSILSGHSGDTLFLLAMKSHGDMAP